MKLDGEILKFNDEEQAIAHLPSVLPLDQAGEALDMVYGDVLETRKYLLNFSEALLSQFDEDGVKNIRLLSIKWLQLLKLSAEISSVAPVEIIDRYPPRPAGGEGVINE